MSKVKTLVFLFFALTAAASLAAAMKVSPAVIEMYILPGGEYEGEFTVVNTAPAPVVVTARFEDESDWDRVLDDPVSGPENFQGWLVMRPDEIRLEAGEENKFYYHVKAPASGIRGELRGHVFFEQRDTDDAEGTLSLVARIGNAVYVVIRGTEDVRGVISEFSFTDTLQAFKVNIRNDGNIHIRPRGDIEIWRFDEASSVTTHERVLAVNERGQPLMLGEEIKFSVPCETPLAPGNYRASVRLGFSNPPVSLAQEVNFTVP